MTADPAKDAERLPQQLTQERLVDMRHEAEHGKCSSFRMLWLLDAFNDLLQERDEARRSAEALRQALADVWPHHELVDTDQPSAADVCPGDNKPCYAGDGDDAHWRCGTVQCPHQETLRSQRPNAGDVERARDEADGLATTAWLRAQQAASGDDAIASMERISAYAQNLARMLPNIIASTRAATRREERELQGGLMASHEEEIAHLQSSIQSLRAEYKLCRKRLMALVEECVANDKERELRALDEAVVEAARAPKVGPHAAGLNGTHGGPLVGVRFVYEDGSDLFVGAEWYRRLSAAQDAAIRARKGE